MFGLEAFLAGWSGSSAGNRVLAAVVGRVLAAAQGGHGRKHFYF